MKPVIIYLMLLAAFLAACAGEQVVEPTAPGEIAAIPLPSLTSPPTEPVLPTQTALPTSAVVETATEETVIPTATLMPEPPLTPEVSEQPPVVEIISGQTEEGAYFYGNPDAAVTLIDYSDFL